MVAPLRYHRANIAVKCVLICTLFRTRLTHGVVDGRELETLLVWVAVIAYLDSNNFICKNSILSILCNTYAVTDLLPISQTTCDSSSRYICLTTLPEPSNIYECVELEILSEAR